MIFFILVLFIILLFVLLSFVWPPDSPWAPQWQINKRNARAAAKLSQITKGDIVYELGCGSGEFIITVAEEFGAKAVGIEIDPIRYLISYIRSKLSKSRNNIHVVRQDFKKVTLSEATVVYMYLVPSAMKRILPLLKKQLKQGTRIISYRYEIPLSSKDKKIIFQKKNKSYKIFLYTITSNT